jgi:hypothetical protein
MNEFGYTIPWYILAFLLSICLFIIWRIDPDKSPNHKRLWGILGPLVSAVRLYELANNETPLIFSQIALILLPALGGLLLILIALIPHFQNGPLEYSSWALWGSFLVLFFFPQSPLLVQWFASFLLIILIYSTQRLEGYPFSHKADPQYTTNVGMRIASWLLGIKPANDRETDGQQIYDDTQKQSSNSEKKGVNNP